MDGRYQEVVHYQKRSSKKKKNRGLFIIIAFFILIALIIFFQSPISKITDITIEGLYLLSQEDISHKAKIEQNMQYFLTSKEKIIDRLLEFEEIKDVQVIKKFPGKLMINITEHKPVAFLLENNKTSLLMENGYIRSWDQSAIFLDIPYITKWNNDQLLVNLAEELKKISPTIQLEISEIQQSTNALYPNELLLITKEGYKVHIKLEDLSEKLKLYPLIVENLKSKEVGLGDIFILESIRFEEAKEETTMAN